MVYVPPAMVAPTEPTVSVPHVESVKKAAQEPVTGLAAGWKEQQEQYRQFLQFQKFQKMHERAEREQRNKRQQHEQESPVSSAVPQEEIVEPKPETTSANGEMQKEQLQQSTFPMTAPAFISPENKPVVSRDDNEPSLTVSSSSQSQSRPHTPNQIFMPSSSSTSASQLFPSSQAIKNQHIPAANPSLSSSKASVNNTSRKPRRKKRKKTSSKGGCNVFAAMNSITSGVSKLNNNSKKMMEAFESLATTVKSVDTGCLG